MRRGGGAALDTTSLVYCFPLPDSLLPHLQKVPASQTLKSLRGRMFSFQSRGLCAMHSLMKLWEAYAVSEGCTSARDRDYSHTVFIRKETVALSEGLFSHASVFPTHRPFTGPLRDNCHIPSSYIRALRLGALNGLPGSGH